MRTELGMGIIIIGIILSCVWIGGYIWFLGDANIININIEKPYLTEYNQCNAKLNGCIESKTPSCAPVVCKTGADSIVFTVMGFILALIGWGSYFYTLNKINKLEEKKKK